MNTIFQRRQYNGFGLKDTLMSRLKFSGVVRFIERSKISKDIGDDILEYWIFKDEFGARFSCFQEKLSDMITLQEPHEVSGEIKIGKGGIFLNLTYAEIFNGGNYTESE